MYNFVSLKNTFMKKSFLAIAAACMLLFAGCSAQKEISNTDIMSMARTDVPSQSYYKDVFLDSGCELDNMKNNPDNPKSYEIGIPAILPAAYYNLFGKDTWQDHLEYVWTSSDEDTLTQNLVFRGSDKDANGVLLYPDGEPRFKMIYTFGGSASKHGKSLGQEGLERVRTFYANGGSYTGSCAGCILAAPYYNGGDKSECHYNIHDGAKYRFTGMFISKNTYTHLVMEPGNPLQKYFSGALAAKTDMDSLRHSGGCMMVEEAMPAGTEILGRFGQPTEGVKLPKKLKIEKFLGQPCIWAYKRNAESGRLVVCGSHPELCNTSEVTELYTAQLRYAMDGFGSAKPKAVLENGAKRTMNNPEDPLYAGIGDRQYHHFLVYLPKPAKRLKITLHYDIQGAGLELSMKRGTYAFPDAQPEYTAKSVAETDDTVTLTARKVPAGLWYISVYCPVTPEAVLHTSTIEGNAGGYVEYVGTGAGIAALNGIGYDIKAEWK